MDIKNPVNRFLSIVLTLSFFSLFSCNSGNQSTTGSDQDVMKKDTLRFGMVVKLDSTRMNEYLALHADSSRGVRDLLSKYGIRNFSIFMTKLEDGNYYEFGYYEYAGNDYEADMASLAKEPRNIEWLKMCDPLQIPLKGETSWKKIDRIFYNK